MKDDVNRASALKQLQAPLGEAEYARLLLTKRPKTEGAPEGKTSEGKTSEGKASEGAIEQAMRERNIEPGSEGAAKRLKAALGAEAVAKIKDDKDEIATTQCAVRRRRDRYRVRSWPRTGRVRDRNENRRDPDRTAVPPDRRQRGADPHQATADARNPARQDNARAQSLAEADAARRPGEAKDRPEERDAGPRREHRDAGCTGRLRQGAAIASRSLPAAEETQWRSGVPEGHPRNSTREAGWRYCCRGEARQLHRHGERGLSGSAEGAKGGAPERNGRTVDGAGPQRRDQQTGRVEC